MAKLKYGLRIPAVHPLDPGALRAFVTRAEELDFDSIWTGDHVFYGSDVPHPLQLLGWIAAMTTRVRLGTAAMLSAYLNPVLLAREAATLDTLSGGRLMLGMSLGGTPAEYSSIGVPVEQRLGRLLENVEIMRRLWREDGVEYQGRYREITGGSVNPKPAQAGGVPILLGGGSEPMLKRIPRVADGWIAAAAGADRFLPAVDTLLAACEAASRDAASLYVGKLQGISLAAMRDQAREDGERHWKAYYGPNWNIDNGTIYGTPDECRAGLTALEAAACDELTLALEPPSLDVTALEQLAEITTKA